MEEGVDPIERPFGKHGIGPECRQEEVICLDHLENGGGRAGQLRQNDIERFSNQRQAVSRRGSGQSKFGKNDPMALEDQWTAVNKRAVEIEDDQLQGSCFLRLRRLSPVHCFSNSAFDAVITIQQR
jgi:hypothetical protein